MSLFIDDVLVPDSSGPTAILLEHGSISRIGGPPPAADVPRLDGKGMLALPGLIDAHAHIDKTLLGGPWVPNPGAEDVRGRIAYEREQRDRYQLPCVDHIATLVEQMIAAGTTHVRTHTDVDPGVGLRGVEAVAEAAARYADAITIEQVAFPQGGLITNPGTLELLRDATQHGATTIGGLDPAGFDDAPGEHLEAIFDLAAETDCGIDIHLHDDGSLGAWEMRQIARQTREHALEHRVTISHAFAIAHPPTQDRVIEDLATSGVALATAAVYDVPVPPLQKLADAGVVLASGSDGIRDLWGPYGDGDMLRRAMHVGYRSGARTDQGLRLAFATATSGAARMLGLVDHGVHVGGTADLVLVRARSVAEAVATVPPRAIVVKGGRIVAREGRLIPAEQAVTP